MGSPEHPIFDRLRDFLFSGRQVLSKRLIRDSRILEKL